MDFYNHSLYVVNKCVCKIFFNKMKIEPQKHKCILKRCVLLWGLDFSTEIYKVTKTSVERFIEKF